MQGHLPDTANMSTTATPVMSFYHWRLRNALQRTSALFGQRTRKRTEQRTRKMSALHSAFASALGVRCCVRSVRCSATHAAQDTYLPIFGYTCKGL